MENVQVYSEKLGTVITIENECVDSYRFVSLDEDSFLVGWSHHGWNNSNGGGSW